MGICGIDPGLGGGIAFMDDSGSILHYQRMPLKPVLDEAGKKTGKKIIDIATIAGMVARFEPEHVFIEKVHAMPKQGVTSMFTFGMGFGMLLGLFYSLEAMLHTELVTPQRWQKMMYTGCSFTEEAGSKAKAMARFYELWPDLEEQGVTHDGVIDACLLAEYGRRSLGLN